MREKFRRVKPLKEITVGRRCCAAPILGQSGSSAPPCWTLDVLNIVLVSATVSVAVCTVPLRTSSTPSVRRDADRRERDARVPHFTRELEKLHPDNPVNNRVTRGGPACPRQNPPATSSLARPRFSAARRPSSPALRNSPDKSAVAGVCRDLIFQHQDAKIRKVFPGALALKTKKPHDWRRAGE